MVRQSQVDPGPDTLLADLLRLPDLTDPVRWLQDHRLSLAARLVLEHLLQRVIPMEDRGGLVCLNSAARFDKWNRAAVR